MAKRDTIVAFPEIAAVPPTTRGKQTKGLEFVQEFLNRFGISPSRNWPWRARSTT